MYWPNTLTKGPQCVVTICDDIWREEGREGVREGGREGGREEGRERGEGGREGGREEEEGGRHVSIKFNTKNIQFLSLNL